MLLIFLPKSNVFLWMIWTLCIANQTTWFFLTNGWMVQIITVCVNLALQQSWAAALKVTCIIMEVPAKNCLTVALQFLQKNGSLCFHYKTFCHCFVTLFRTKKISSWIFGTLTICTLIMNKLQISHNMFNFKKTQIIMIN